MSLFRKTGRGVVDDSKVINFTFDGKAYQGLEGDTVASALLANGNHLMGRSFKYHRPRGVLGAGWEEPNALIAVDRGKGRVTPNVRATTQEIYEGLKAESQNRSPNLKFDMGAFNNAFSMFFPAGFYNKTFMWPKSFWDKVYEPFIRNMAGLGPAPDADDPDVYASTYGHCETLIIGAGPAGIAAALSASKSGERIILVDENAHMGGSLRSTPNIEIGGKPASKWLEASLKALTKAENVTLMTRTTATGYYHDNFVALAERVKHHIPNAKIGKVREALHRIRAGKVILAQGGIERPLVFNGNDRPGIMLASAAQTYLGQYGVAVGNEVAVFTSHDSAYQAAFDVADANTRIAAIIDVRSTIRDDLIMGATQRGIKIIKSAAITKTFGKLRVNACEVYEPESGKKTKINCDAILMCGGWTPSLHLWSHSKGGIKWDADLAAYIPDMPNENAVCIGACNGDFGVAAALSAGHKAGGGRKAYKTNEIEFGSGVVLSSLPSYLDSSKQKAFVDFQNDVTEKDIKLAVSEGFKSIEHVKRYTTNGMATDQGKTSNLNALEIASKAVGKPIEKVGLTTFRPPYTPTTFGTFTGYRDNELFDPTRKTPIDPWAEANGAAFEPVGHWRRAWYFPKDGEDMHAAVARECKATRESLGIFDASTLGKIEVVGPDAAKFMNLMYTNPWSKLPALGCRYGLMCREDGYIYDDGVVGRMAEDRFHVTTTTGGAPRVYRHMEDYLQTEFPELDVWLTSTTEQWAVIAINGPNARKLIEPFVEGIDLSPEAFPHMTLREGKICGVPTRLFRVSFTGELGFEINIPAHYGRLVWENLFEAGQQYNICPYGTETMHVLRAEKGFIIVGQDTDGTVTAHDAGMSWAVSKKKRDFVGKRSLARPDLVAKGRKQLIGLLTENPNEVLEEGAQIVDDPNQAIPMDMLGHVTSSYWSEPLGRSIAMAVVRDGFDRMDETLSIPMPGKVIKAKVVKPVFYDPKGERLNVV
ncbi:sarcosine oxidase subunit alpha family protein [Hellea balneolensis]|uniref:sarcosine oxidase subunit alpha family protein n=1 Tax=Hellea balneolensis TaxID=287478 RepID=UPI000411B210|nr:sarcosine oxidase subunit alpha family protein [Hellea balneolensis]